MEEVILWLFRMLSTLISTMLTWKIIGDFSFLHILIGILILTSLFKVITFGFFGSSHKKVVDNDE